MRGGQKGCWDGPAAGGAGGVAAMGGAGGQLAPIAAPCPGIVWEPRRGSGQPPRCSRAAAPGPFAAFGRQMHHPPRQPAGYRPGKYPCPGTRRTRIVSLNPGCSGEPIRGLSVYLDIDAKEKPLHKQDCSTGSLCPGTGRVRAHAGVFAARRSGDVTFGVVSPREVTSSLSPLHLGEPGWDTRCRPCRASLAEEVGDS